MALVKIPTTTWVELYSEFSAYVEEKSALDNHFDDNGNRKEEYQGEFESIVDDVEEIMSKIFIKGY